MVTPPNGRLLKLVVFDLDGTVLPFGADALTPRTAAALRKACGAGCILAAATGRTRCIVPPAILGLPLLRYLITSNGAGLTDLSTDACLYSAYLPRQTALEVIARQRDAAAFNVFFPHRAVLESNCVSYMLAFGAGTAAETARRRREMAANADIVPSIEDVLRQDPGPIEKLGCSYPTPRAAEAALRTLSARTDIEAVMVMPTELEITAAGVNKGRALAMLLSHLGLTPRQVIAFGDGENDRSMRESAGVLVAMDGGSLALKASADLVAPPIGEDGVAQILEALF